MGFRWGIFRTTWRITIVRRTTKVILVAAGGFLLAAAALAGNGLHDTVARADVIVVPGNTVAPDGTPSPRLQARLDAALVLYREGRSGSIFVSGGTGVEGVDEAAAMARYLIARGVPEEAVVQDGAGVDTEATAVHAAAFLSARGLRTALVATQYFHVPRTRLALERHGADVVGSRHARYVEARDPYSLAREVVALPVYALRS